MKIVLLGMGGMLACDIFKVFCNDFHLIGLSEDDVDITDVGKLNHSLDVCNADVVINCAAYTDVDKSETETEKAIKVNGTALIYISEWCLKNHSKLVHFSTDYVFDGASTVAYDEKANPNPINAYGKSKLLGEQNILQVMKNKGKFQIIRSSWLYGLNGRNFVKTIINLAQNKKNIKIVDDQFGKPTYTYDLAQAVKVLMQYDQSGIFHICNSGYTSWSEFAEYFMEKMGGNNNIIGIPSEDFQTATKRPRFSVLATNYFENLTSYKMPAWQDAVSRYLNQM